MTMLKTKRRFTFITNEQKDKAWEEKKKQLNCYHYREKWHIKSKCPKYRVTRNMTVEGVPSEVGGNINEATGSDDDGQCVTSGVTHKRRYQC